MEHINLSKYPYGSITQGILDVIVELLNECYLIDKEGNSESIISNNPRLLDITSKLIEKGGLLWDWHRGKYRGKDKHLIEGFSNRHQREKRYPRLINITIQAYFESKKHNESLKSSKSKSLPSPLYILYKYLTIPNHIQTSLYSQAVCKEFIFYYLKQKETLKTKNDRLIVEEQYYDVINSFKNYEYSSARWPELNDKFYDQPFSLSLPNRSKLNYAIGHFLAMRGFAFLWFAETKEMEDFLKLPVSFSKKVISPNYHFRPSYFYKDLPSISEIINNIFGIPVPLEGFDIVFSGGLKMTPNSGVVMSVSGNPGAGKTSFALALAASLSPLGIKCFYLTLEEGISEIKTRLKSIVPSFYDTISFYKRFNMTIDDSETKEGSTIKTNEWFFPAHLKGNSSLDDFSDFISELKLRKKDSSKDSITNCHTLVVIDNINNLIDKNRPENNTEIFHFIQECRRLDTFVIVLSGSEVPEITKMDYLVDISVSLENRNTLNVEEKPFRVFILKKSRHQLARNGAHLFHLSGEKGFRISPQIPSQLDKKSPLKKQFPKDDLIINTLNLGKIYTDKLVKEKITYKSNLDIYPKSQILIHGNGSCGKAGFALKLLLTPPLRHSLTSKFTKKDTRWLNVINNLTFEHPDYKRKVLVVSFLYQDDYYSELANDISKSISVYYPKLINPEIDCISFYPGFLSPEDLVNKITKVLDEAEFNGLPYNGLLLDGMHNVFLQFKKLQERDMIWPMLYNIFSHYDLTVVTTFTNFKVEEGLLEYGDVSPDASLMQKGQTPFLHALVKASDFYITISEELREEQEDQWIKRNIIRVRIAIRQVYENFELGWDKQRKFIYKLPKYLTIL